MNSILVFVASVGIAGTNLTPLPTGYRYLGIAANDEVVGIRGSKVFHLSTTGQPMRTLEVPAGARAELDCGGNVVFIQPKAGGEVQFVWNGSATLTAPPGSFPVAKTQAFSVHDESIWFYDGQTIKKTKVASQLNNLGTGLLIESATNKSIAVGQALRNVKGKTLIRPFLFRPPTVNWLKVPKGYDHGLASRTVGDHVYGAVAEGNGVSLDLMGLATPYQYRYALWTPLGKTKP
jgi:hypothetical protein